MNDKGIGKREEEKKRCKGRSVKRRKMGEGKGQKIGKKGGKKDRGNKKVEKEKRDKRGAKRRVCKFRVLGYLYLYFVFCFSLTSLYP